MRTESQRPRRIPLDKDHAKMNREELVKAWEEAAAAEAKFVGASSKSKAWRAARKHTQIAQDALLAFDHNNAEHPAALPWRRIEL